MGNKILVLGESGVGKTTSLQNLPPESTYIVNVIGKPLPFQGWKKKYTKFDKASGKGNIISLVESNSVLACMNHVNEKLTHIKTLIIDDAQYIMSYEFMDRAKEKGFDKFIEIGQNMFKILRAPDTFRDDLTVVFISHSEDVSGSSGTRTKIKTIGKMLDEKITIEGMFTVVLLATCYKNTEKQMEYVFITKSNGTNPAKTPIGMFEDLTIPNDLNAVLKRVNEY